EVLTELIPRLWESARVAREKDVPTPMQAQAKDAMFELRGFADEATRRRIDSYLIEWLAGGHYEGRATVGRVSGRTIVRRLGPTAAPKLLEAARSILVRPPDAEGKRPVVGDELLAAIASTGDPEAVALLLDMVTKDYKDPSLPKRAMAALHEAYVQPVSGQPVSARPALLGQVERLGQVARDENLPGVMNNDAVELIAAIGPPECIPPFVELVVLPTTQQSFRWVGIQKGLRCGGAQAMVPIMEAAPDTIPYERALLEKYVLKEILASPGASKVAEQARLLLTSRNWVARVTGIEVLGALKQRATAAEDAKRIRQLAKDRTVLKGWWGPQKELPDGKKKPDPTIGRVAEEVAGGLQGLAKGPESK
ncbi:MAG TPA: hypothetical protein VNO33_00355, partial [Kofleriaceae bacterium]|nr:hypothetical protein [Kofleriaceae bacterium]